MRYLITILLVLCSVAEAQPSQTIIARRRGSSIISPALNFTLQTGIDNAGQANGGTHNLTNPSLVLNVNAPNGTYGGSNNCLVIVAHAATTWTLGTPTDNIGGDTYTAITSATGTSNTIVFKTWVVFGVPAGVKAVTIPTTGSAGSPAIYLGGWAGEFRNCGGTQGGSGFLSFTANSSAHNVTLSSAPSSGDMVLLYALDTNFGLGQGDCIQNAITVGSGYTLLHKSTCYGKVAQFNTATTSTSVPITYAGTDTIGAVALVIKQGAAGVSPTGKFIDHEQTEEAPSASTSWTIPFPSSGNLLVGLYSAPNGNPITSSTSANAGSPTFAFTCLKNNPTSNVESQIWYGTGATLSSTTTVTPTISSASAGVQLELYSVSNAQTSSFVKCSAGTSQNHATASNLTADTITPTNGTGDFVFNTVAIDFHTLMGMVTDANSHLPTFAAAVNSKGDDADPSCTTGIATPPSTLAEDNGYSIIKTTNTTLISFIYSGSQTTGGCTGTPTGTVQDASVSAEFQ